MNNGICPVDRNGEHCPHVDQERPGVSYEHAGVQHIVCCHCGARGTQGYTTELVTISGHGPFYRVPFQHQQEIHW